jgi:polyhydroxyalkanoate synthesis regulator protein
MAKLIKRYARSRLYDTQAARYVTLANPIFKNGPHAASRSL